MQRAGLLQGFFTTDREEKAALITRYEEKAKTATNAVRSHRQQLDTEAASTRKAPIFDSP